MSSKPVVLIIGSGPRIGASVARKFAALDYSVAIVSRKAESADDYLSIKTDVSDPSCIPSIFDAVQAEFKTFPSVIIYNAAAMTPPAGDDLFTIPVQSVADDFNTNTVSVFAAAKEAVKGWQTLTADAKKVFIYTGNRLNTWVAPMLMTATLGMGKSATAYFIGTADMRYAKEGYRFFYADERNEDGSNKGMQIDGDAHAEFYADLASGEADVPWHATFVKGEGYRKF
ncbi:hypothetical protein DE146DRAFT_678975 [Phaeosphaeria sp. MPI-PUGE-AT-0046c]|nr:hypothetical protein DE146DRAFT_678975 [Phaeosphaeria sp. MPI-PUGE-AT-0046c]